MKLLICGDSYAQENYESFTWPTKLSKKYDTTNLARNGTGPQWSLMQLIDYLEHNDTKDTTVLFFVSSHTRIDLKDHPISEQWKLKYSTNKYVKWLFKNYITTASYDQTEKDKIICLVAQYAKYFKKVLIWDIFGKKSDLEYSFLPNVTVIDKYDLYTIEYRENRPPQDHCINHLHKENHDIMYDMLDAWIEKNIAIDPKKLQKIN